MVAFLTSLRHSAAGAKQGRQTGPGQTRILCAGYRVQGGFLISASSTAGASKGRDEKTHGATKTAKPKHVAPRIDPVLGKLMTSGVGGSRETDFSSWRWCARSSRSQLGTLFNQCKSRASLRKISLGTGANENQCQDVWIDESIL